MSQEQENSFGSGSTAASPYPEESGNADLRSLEREHYTPKTYSWKKGGGRPDRGVGWGMAQVNNGHFLLGDPDTLIERITAQQKETQAGVLIIRPEMGNMTLQEAGDGMELFAREVL